jgi:hypothetical protein
MIPVVGNLVAALVAPRLDDGYDEVRTSRLSDCHFRFLTRSGASHQVAWLWYGFAILYWIPLFVMSVLRVTTREALGTQPLPISFGISFLLTPRGGHHGVRCR